MLDIPATRWGALMPKSLCRLLLPSLWPAETAAL
jgi:hypothetical protein